MAVSSSTIIEDVTLFIRNLLYSITDPLNRSGGGNQFIFTSYPKVNIQYPIITIKQTNFSTSKLGMSSELHYATIQLEIQVWARNSKEVDELTSDVIDLLRDAQYSATGTDNEDIYGFTLTSCVPIVETEGNKTIHRKVMTYEYKVILGQ